MRSEGSFPTGDRDLLLLSPHLDDAWLSAAELILGTDCSVWTVFAGAPDPVQQTAWDVASGFADSAGTMAARTAEDIAAFADLEHRVLRLPYLEASYAEPPLRRRQAAALRADLREWTQQHPGGVLALPVCAGVHVEPAAWEKARERMRGPVEKPASEVAPAPSDPSAAQEDSHEGRRAAASLVRRAMHADHQRRRRRAQRRGMAVNPDHLLVREVGLDVALDTSDVDVLLWEDLPYLWHERGAARVRELERTRQLVAERTDVEVDVERKHDHVRHYASQLDVLDPAYKRLAGKQGLPTTETYWMMRRRIS